MDTPLTNIRNIGPAMAGAFERAGIATAEELRALGTDAAYRRLLQTGHRPHFISYYVIEMGLQGRPWNDCKGTEKEALRRRFDALKATSQDLGFSELERALDAIGVVARPGKTTQAAPGA
jgi:DNA transformation protein and related proteins